MCVYAQEMELEAHNSNKPCVFCPASATTLPWRDFRFGVAEWMDRIWRQKDWAAAHPNRNALLCLDFVTVHCLFSDVMHVKYMGTDMYLLARMYYVRVQQGQTYSFIAWLLQSDLKDAMRWHDVMRLFASQQDCARTLFAAHVVVVAPGHANQSWICVCVQ